MSKARPETAAGGRRLSEAHRAKLSAASKAQWAAMTPDQKATALARIGRGAKSPAPPAGGAKPAASTPSAGGRPNPLAMTPRELWRALRAGTTTTERDGP